MATKKKTRAPGDKDVDGDTSAREPVIHIRLSPFTLMFLDEAAKRNGRTRTAEIVERLHDDAIELAQEKANPEYMALLMFTRRAIDQLARYVGRMDPVNRGTALDMIRQNLSSLFGELGAAAPTEATRLLGKVFAQNFISSAREALKLAPAELTPAQKEIVHAAQLWQLDATGEKTDE
ncbi:MAG TPA: TraY domain-containing protein [Rhizomicrobium sp.]|jgi:hypothetical protein|nr:TraY domain-containing protein [Rhizomicrobium sp.]